jgi:hypothetical protein
VFLTTVMMIIYLSNTTDTFLFTDKNRLHVSAYHKSSSGQLFAHSTNCILICVFLSLKRKVLVVLDRYFIVITVTSSSSLTVQYSCEKIIIAVGFFSNRHG